MRNKDLSFEKKIPYRGYTINVWGKEWVSERTFPTNDILFETHWEVNNYGQYNTGVCVDNLKTNIESQIEAAKKYIDSFIDKPNKIREAINIVNSL